MGALKTKGIPGESGKLLGWKVIKEMSVGGDFQRERQAQEHARAGQLHGCCPLEVCCNSSHKIQVIRDMKLGPVFKKTEIGGNPKALDKESCISKEKERIRSVGERSAGVREESRQGPEIWKLNTERRHRAMGGLLPHVGELPVSDELGTRNQLRRESSILFSYLYGES